MNAAHTGTSRRRHWLFWPGMVIGAIWTSPWTLLGLIAGVAGMPAGASMHFNRRDRALVFHRWPWGPGGAMTLAT